MSAITERKLPLATPDRDLFLDALRLTAHKCIEDETALGAYFPHVTEPDGSWRLFPASVSAGYTDTGWSHGNWTCGFWVGLLVAGWLATEDERCIKLARERMQLIAPRCEDGNTHDIGFIFEGSALPLWQATGEDVYARTALRAAEKLRSRVVRTHQGSYIASWGPLSDPRGRESSAIDTMANLPLLYWASTYTGDASFALVAKEHAKMTARAFIRDDHSTYHAVQYDTTTGDRLKGYTFQGYGDESFWSRGQGWAVYGFAATAEATGQQHYLDLALKLAEKYFQSAGGRVVPPWDFDDPDPQSTLDSSAASIMAAAVLYAAALSPDAQTARHWNDRGISVLRSLCDNTLARESSHRGLLRHGCYSRPHDDGTDSAVMFGDFFFVEALARLVFPGRFVVQPSPLTP